MSTSSKTVSQREYLKKYQTKPEKKKSTTEETRKYNNLRVTDDDRNSNRKEVGKYDIRHVGGTPFIATAPDDRSQEIRGMEVHKKTDRWKSLVDLSRERQRLNSARRDVQSSPQKYRTNRRADRDTSPPRKNKPIDRENFDQRSENYQRHDRIGDRDLSPSRRSKQIGRINVHNPESRELTPPRKNRRIDSLSPRRCDRSNDFSPFRTRNNFRRVSPPIRNRPTEEHTKDLSPRRREHNDRYSPYRRSDFSRISPGMRGNCNRNSPLKRHEINRYSPLKREDAKHYSPPRRNYIDRPSPPRRDVNNRRSPARKDRNLRHSSPRRVQINWRSPPRKDNIERLSPYRRDYNDKYVKNVAHSPRKDYNDRRAENRFLKDVSSPRKENSDRYFKEENSSLRWETFDGSARRNNVDRYVINKRSRSRSNPRQSVRDLSSLRKNPRYDSSPPRRNEVPPNSEKYVRETRYGSPLRRSKQFVSSPSDRDDHPESNMYNISPTRRYNSARRDRPDDSQGRASKYFPKEFSQLDVTKHTERHSSGVNCSRREERSNGRAQVVSPLVGRSHASNDRKIRRSLSPRHKHIKRGRSPIGIQRAFPLRKTTY